MYNEEKKRKIKKDKKISTEFLSKFFHKRTKRLLTDIDRLFRKLMWFEIGISIAIILIGVIFLLWPSISVTIVSIFFGIMVVLFGAINIYEYRKRRELPFFKFHIVYGILAIILGIITILNPFTFSQVITLFIGMWILYLAICKIDFALRLKVLSEKSWLFLLISAVLEIFMSILIFRNPFSNLLLTQICGAYFILCGIINCTDVILTKNRAIDFLENI